MKIKSQSTLVIGVILIIIIILLSIYLYNLSSKNNTINSQINDLNIQIQEKEQEISTKNQEITELKQKLNNVEQFNKFYSKALTEYNYGVFDKSTANYNYDLWSFYYGEGYFVESITYCIAAREAYVSSNTYYQNTINYFEEAKKTADKKYIELIDYYIKASNSIIDINWAMYEVCEYFETASDFYSKSLWDSGDSALESGNEKIAKHDNLIKSYNSYVSKIEVLEESI